PQDSTDLFHGFLWPPEWDRGEKVKTTRDDSMLLGYSDGSGLLDDDLFMDFNDTLFNSLIPNQPYAFPNPREIAREAGLAEFMQPGLVALQTNLDDFMDTLEPLQDLLSSRLPLASVPEEDQASIHLSEVGSHPPTTSVAPPAPISPQAMPTASPAPITTVPSPQMQMHPLYSDASGGRGASSLVSPCHPGEGVSSPYLDLDHHKYMAQEQHPPMISPLPPPALSGRVSKRFPPQGGKGLGGKVSASSVPVGGGKSLESLFSMTTPSVTQSQEAKQATPISVVHHTRGNRRSGVSSALSASPKKSSANSFPIQLSQEPQDNAVSNAVDVKPSLTAYQQLTSPVSTVASANVSVGRRSRGSGDIHRRSSQGSIDSLQLGVIVHPRTRSEDQDFVMPEMAPRNRGRNNSSPIPNALLGGTGSSGNMAPLVQLSTRYGPVVVVFLSQRYGPVVVVFLSQRYGPVVVVFLSQRYGPVVVVFFNQRYGPAVLLSVAPSEQKPAFGRFPSVPPSAQQQAYYRSTHAPTSSHYSPSKEPHRTTSVPSSPLTTMSSPTSPLDGVASPSMLSGVGSPLSQKGDTREHRRVTHINAEHKRRCHIKNGFELLHALVPKLNLNPNSKVRKLNLNPNSKVSKAGMLEKGAEYISQLKEERKTVEEEMENLKREIKELTADINECQAHLPDTGAPVSSTRNSRINDLFEKYVREQTRRDWKFWVFAQLMSPMVESFGRSVSTTSLDDLCRSTLSWSEQHCALVDLRKSVTSSLCHLGVSTSILSDPSRLAIEAVARGGSGPCDLSMSSPTSGFSSVTSSTSSSASPGSSTPTLYRSRR
ncbi:unnamed protein product, partial [Cyprideis torosa]